MTREEMIAMAREAGCVEASHPFNPWSVSQEAIERFAAFVIATERERCALVCEEFYSVEGESGELKAAEVMK
jgi:hypothetical protein